MLQKFELKEYILSNFEGLADIIEYVDEYMKRYCKLREKYGI